MGGFAVLGHVMLNEQNRMVKIKKHSLILESFKNSLTCVLAVKHVNISLLCRLSVTRFNNCAVEEAQYRWACKVLQRFSPHLENFMGAILWSTPLPIISVLNTR